MANTTYTFRVVESYSSPARVYEHDCKSDRAAKLYARKLAAGCYAGQGHVEVYRGTKVDGRAECIYWANA